MSQTHNSSTGSQRCATSAAAMARWTVTIHEQAGKWKLRLHCGLKFADRVETRDAAPCERARWPKQEPCKNNSRRQYRVSPPDNFPGVQYRRVPSWQQRARAKNGPRTGRIIEEIDRTFADRSWWVLTPAEKWLPMKYLILVTKDEAAM